MSNVNDISESIRNPIIEIAEAQKKIKQMNLFNDRREYLVKEFASICLTQAEAALLGVNDICSNIENCSELGLSMAINGMKLAIESINPQSQNFS